MKRWTKIELVTSVGTHTVFTLMNESVFTLAYFSSVRAMEIRSTSLLEL